MSLWEALVLGIIQGITEFLPVSSSGHLALTQILLGLHPPLFFDVFVHVATLLATIFVFWTEFRQLLASIPRLPKFWIELSKNKQQSIARDSHAWMSTLILISSTVTAVIGLALKDTVEAQFHSSTFVGSMLIITAIILFASQTFSKHNTRSLSELTKRDAVLMGVFQGLAVLPGISRSGSTIGCGLFLSWKRELVGRYAFLVSIPAILGAFILSMNDVDRTHIQWSSAGIGFISAFATGVVSLKLLLRWIQKGKLSVFAFYCALLGVGALGFGLLR